MSSKEQSPNLADLPDIPGDITKDLPAGSPKGASTEFSKFRTRMSEHRTNLSEHRTKLSDMRTHLSNERTHLSQVRTSVSLMSFGITLNRFSVYLQESRRAPEPGHGLAALRDVEHVGTGMVVLGIILLLWSQYRYNTVHKQIETLTFTPPTLAVTILTIGILALGAASAVWLISS